MKIITAIKDDEGNALRECEITIDGKVDTEGIWAEVEEALDNLLDKWKYGPAGSLKGAKVHYVFRSCVG